MALLSGENRTSKNTFQCLYLKKKFLKVSRGPVSLEIASVAKDILKFLIPLHAGILYSDPPASTWMLGLQDYVTIFDLCHDVARTQGLVHVGKSSTN